MPEMDNQRPRRTIEDDGFIPNPPADYVELGVTTCFSFLRGASDAVDLASTANALGYDKLGCADLNTMAAHNARCVPDTYEPNALQVGRCPQRFCPLHHAKHPCTNQRGSPPRPSSCRPSR